MSQDIPTGWVKPSRSLVTLAGRAIGDWHMIRNGDLFHASFYFVGTLAAAGGSFLAGLLLIRLIQKSAGV